MNLRPAVLRKDWPSAKIDIQACMGEDSSDVWLEDVYCEIKEGRAFLFVLMDDDEDHGTVVLTKEYDRWSGEPSLHIWYAMGLPGSGEVLEEIYQIARNEGAAYVSFKCSKTSVQKWAEVRGFVTTDIEMRYGIAKANHADPA